MLDEFIGNSDASHGGLIAMVGHEFQYSAAHASAYDAVFYGDNAAELAAYFVEHLFVQWFQEAQIVVGNGYALLFLRTCDGTCGYVPDRA